MKTKIAIGKMEYTINPIPPYLAPVQTYIEKLTKTTPESYEEAVRISDELSKAMAKIFEATTTPTPTPDNATAIYKAIQDYTVKVIRDAQFFRISTKPDSNQSGNPRPNPT